MISAVVAVDENYGIGYKGELLCHIKEDLRRFKNITTDGVVVMGRNTWDSLSNEPLPNRTNVVITSHVDGMQIKNGVIYTTLDLFKNCITDIGNEYDVFVIGGGQIYKELLPYCSHIHLTKIHKEFENVDTYFPNIEEDEWYVALEGDVIHTKNNIDYQFYVYRRKE